MTAKYSQLIDQSIHITNRFSSCIDLTFTANSSFVKDSGVESGVKCHHNITFGKESLKIPLPPPYTGEVWNYEKANVEGIQRSISGIDWNISGIFLKELPFMRKFKS